MYFLSPDLKFPTEICHYFLIFFNTQSNRKESSFENKEDDTLFL